MPAKTSEHEQIMTEKIWPTDCVLSTLATHNQSAISNGKTNPVPYVAKPQLVFWVTGLVDDRMHQHLTFKTRWNGHQGDASGAIIQQIPSLPNDLAPAEQLCGSWCSFVILLVDMDVYDILGAQYRCSF